MLYLCCMLDFFLLETRECPLNPTKPLVFLQNMGSLEQRLGMADHTDTLSWFSLFGFLGQSTSFSPCCRSSVSSTLVSTVPALSHWFSSTQSRPHTWVSGECSLTQQLLLLCVSDLLTDSLLCSAHVLSCVPCSS